MFDSAHLDHQVSKETYKKEEPKLRAELLEAQMEMLKAKKFPVLILVGGVGGAGKGETVNLLNEWMDPRHIHTVAFGDPNEEEAARPSNWRYWQNLPPRGRIGIFFGGWHSLPIRDRVRGDLSRGEFEEKIADIQRFERMLTDEGTLLIKLWFYLSKKQLKHRLEELEGDKRTRWRVGPEEWGHFKTHDKFIRTSEHLIRATSTGEAPWVIVPGADPLYRTLLVGRTVLASIKERLAQTGPTHAANTAAPMPAQVDRVNVLRALKLDQGLKKDDYEEELEKWQGRLAMLARHKKFQDVAVVTVFEGNDAAGKGGAIRRITSALDARYYRGVPIAAPSEEERAQPYLWRFWRHLPRKGRFTIFDRSWYGRVLVERVEGFCSEYDWMRGYSEINDFEAQMVRHDTVVVKYWLAISKEEQLKRFNAREEIAHKKWKITDEDWRNRKKWGDYEKAVCDMVDRTSTEVAPWTLVEANNKYFARIKVLKTLVKAVEKKLDSM
jgi:polyphosphate:AMP phosphotransferase